MKAHAFRGATMALYAVFLVVVGIPLLALTVDVTHVYSANVRLRNATAAGCEAYARSLDTKIFVETGETKISPDAAGNAYQVFTPSAPQGSTLEITATIKNNRVVAMCVGRNSLRPLIPLFPVYNLSSKAASKADFATTKNW
jgi:Flp pilus assembly protein TadG